MEKHWVESVSYTNRLVFGEFNTWINDNVVNLTKANKRLHYPLALSQLEVYKLSHMKIAIFVVLNVSTLLSSTNNKLRNK